MKISVIIPSWNRAERLCAALQSVYAQTRQADEVIVVDDGSTDDTRQRVHTQFPDARYIYQPNSGVSSARNTGIAAATGDWIALLDSDDRWQTNKLEQQQQQLQTQPEYRIAHCDEIWLRHGTRVNPMKKHAKRGGYIYQHCLPLCAISPSAVLIHRDIFKAVGLFDEQLPACEDYDLWLRICASYPVLFNEMALVIKTGGHDDQLSRRYWGMDRFRIQALEKILASDSLDPADRAATLAMLRHKLNIVLKGAVKHNNQTLTRCYHEKLLRYQSPQTDKRVLSA